MTSEANNQLQSAKDAMMNGEYDKAVEALSDILAQEPQDSEVYIDALVSMGEIQWQRGKYDTAIGTLETARELGLKNNRQDLSGWATRLIGNVLIDQGLPSKAQEYYSQALELFQGINNKRGTARCLNNLGVANAERGEYEKALEYYNRALDFYKEIEDKVGEGAVINNLGEVYRFRGEYEEAEYLYRRSIDQDKLSI